MAGGGIGHTSFTVVEIPILLVIWALAVHLLCGGKYWLWPFAIQDLHDDEIHQEIQDNYVTKRKLNGSAKKRQAGP